jgi:branched-chain amino acid transport system permease protein
MLIQQLVNGLTLGAVYTLVALSFSLVMGILGVLNIAIAELFMIGGFIGFTLIAAGMPIPIALAGGMVVAGLIAVVIEKIGYQPLRDAPLIVPLLSTLGFSIILRDIATNVWGSDPMLLQGDFLASRFEFGSVSVGGMQLVVLLTTVILVAALAWLVQRTPIGRGLRAVAENRDVARLLGVSAARLTTVAFVLSGLLAGAAGVLIGMHYTAITPYIGVETGLKAIAVMVVGGVTRIWGALLAGPLIGILEVLTVAYGGSQVRDMVVYGFMILILLLRPQGLLGGRVQGMGRV